MLENVALWYINLRLQHPNISPKQLHDQKLQKNYIMIHVHLQHLLEITHNLLLKEREALMKKYNLNHKNGNTITFNKFIKDEIIKIIEDNLDPKFLKK